jgi:8-oxo-dGTP pyrophosphatase MutT (NUDIX family)
VLSSVQDEEGGVEILLVSSRDTGRWIIPKGWPMDRETPAAAAAMEAWEEAGVRGRVYETCVGHYSYHKWIDEELSLPVIVAVFPVEVLRIDDDFPEAGQRKRKWLSPKKGRAPGVGAGAAAPVVRFDVPRPCAPDALDHRTGRIFSGEGPECP